MPRNLPSAISLATAKNYQRTAHLFRAVFSNAETGEEEEYLLTDNFRDVEVGGKTYLAVGHLLSFDGVEEASDFQIATARVSLSGVDGSLISAVFQYEYIDRELEISRVFFSIPAEMISAWNDADSLDDPKIVGEQLDQLIGNPIKIFAGRMAAPAISEDPDSGKCVVSLSATSFFADFERRPGRHTNHQEQQAYFPGDRFFEGWGDPSQDLVWGHA